MHTSTNRRDAYLNKSAKISGVSRLVVKLNWLFEFATPWPEKENSGPWKYRFIQSVNQLWWNRVCDVNCRVPGLMATTRMLPITVGIVLVIMMYKKQTALTFPFDFGSMEAVPVILRHVWLMCIVWCVDSTVLFFFFFKLCYEVKFLIHA